jgi:LPPG:FO 2-phospho-L-lactate transferase
VKVVLLSGGGGGARFARGLAAVLDPGELTVIGNVGDDVEILGLQVSPDLDSLLYTLAALIDAERGWGRADETWNALDSAADWGGESWFRLGDRDLGIHLVRTQLLRSGVPLSTITAGFTGLVGLATAIVPATDDRLRTHVVTPAGRFGFQDWFVGRHHADDVDAVEYDGASDARPGAGVIEALGAADAIVFAPSNPYLSIGPILAVEAVAAAISARSVRCVAVSPLVGGVAVTGPVDRMLTRMAGGTTPAHVTQGYKGLIDALVIDESDAPADAEVELVATRTLMVDHEAERQLAEVVLETACG